MTGLVTQGGNWRALSRNTVLNLAGGLVPSLVAIATIPYTLHGMGVERFGILSLYWVAFGYFAVVDLGLARAVTNFVAEALGRDDEERVVNVVWTALALQLVLSALGSVVLALGSQLIFDRFLVLSPGLRQEAKSSFHLLCMAIPIITCANTLRGILEAGQRFDLVNTVRILSTSSAFILPALAVYLGFGLRGTTALLVGSLLCTAVGSLLLCFRVYPYLKRRLSFQRELLRPLFTYGGWVTLSGILIPFLVSSDRLLLGSMVSVAALGIYTVPAEMAARLQVLPGSLTATLFPAFSMSAASRKEVGAVYARGLTFSLLLLGPATLLGVVLAPQILRLWVGGQVAVQGALVLQVLVIGRFLNALSQTPASLLDGLGKPDLRAKVFFVFAPIYLALAWYCIRRYGALGAAAAWGLRSAGELIVFLAVASHQVGAYGASPTERRMLLRFGGLAAFAMVAPLPIVFWSHGITTQTICALAATALFVYALWRWVLSDAERLGAWAMLSRLTPLRLRTDNRAALGVDDV